jgi:hypothetical protein
MRRCPERPEEPAFADATYVSVVLPDPAPGETVNHEESEIAVHEQPDPVERMTVPAEDEAEMDAALDDTE